MGERLVEVLVAAPGEADDDHVALQLGRSGERVGGLERGDDPLRLGQPAEGVERLVVGRRAVLDAARVAQLGMLRPDARVVESGRDRVRVDDLAVLVGEQRGARAVEDARSARAEARRPGRLDAVEADVPVVQEAGEHPDRIRATADAGDRGVRQPALGLEDLRARLAADHRL